MTATTTTRRRTLAQVIAIEAGLKAQAEGTLTAAYHQLQKAAPLSGLSRRYTPRDDDGDRFPDEETRVQVRVEDVNREVAEALTRVMDVTATKDAANTVARADVVIDGQSAPLLADVPVTFLLTLEKRVRDLRTYIAKLPILDLAEEWQRDPVSDSWATPVTETVKTKKVPRNHVRAEATDKHPAQVDVFTEDVVVGTWATKKYSGAVPAARRTSLLHRVDALAEAIKVAREAANATPVTDVHVGDAIFSYLFS